MKIRLDIQPQIKARLVKKGLSKFVEFTVEPKQTECCIEEWPIVEGVEKDAKNKWCWVVKKLNCKYFRKR